MCIKFSTVQHFIRRLLCPIRFFRFNHFVVHVRRMIHWTLKDSYRIEYCDFISTAARHTIVYCMKSHHHWEKNETDFVKKEWQQRNSIRTARVVYEWSFVLLWRYILVHIKIHIYGRFSRLFEWISFNGCMARNITRIQAKVITTLAHININTDRTHVLNACQCVLFNW